MFQRKPKSNLLEPKLVLVAALLGQFTWESFADSIDQYTW
jgi:hypothetical protein